MPKYLLDANISPRVARFLSRRFGLDVVSLLDLGLGELPDRDVLRLARSDGRVVITLDSDFEGTELTSARMGQGVVYLDLPRNRRYVPDIEVILAEFFETAAVGINVEHSLVIVREDGVEVRGSGRRAIS